MPPLPDVLCMYPARIPTGANVLLCILPTYCVYYVRIPTGVSNTVLQCIIATYCIRIWYLSRQVLAIRYRVKYYSNVLYTYSDRIPTGADNTVS